MEQLRGIRSKNGSTAEFLTITPDLAKKWLAEHFSDNVREVNLPRLKSFCEEVRSDRWVMDGSPIRFINGKGVDGRHRLRLIVELGITVETLVVRLTDERAILTIDGGKDRTASTLVKHVCKTLNENAVAAGVRRILQFENGKISQQYTPVYTNRQITTFTQEHPEAIPMATFGRKAGLKGMLYGSEVAWLIWAADKSGLRSQAEEFFALLASGANLTQDDPILRLREKLSKVNSPKARPSAYYLRALMVTAWNKWRRGEACKFIRALVGPSQNGGNEGQGFPDIDLAP